MPYEYSKFEKNVSMRRSFFSRFNLFLIWCEEEEEEKCEENWAVFKNAYLGKRWRDFPQIWYVRWCIWRA